ncbi:MAG: endonuclease/exonuclease/phosphatase family protein [Bacteroidales bacterium]|jgi:endonuclease/exonuclease/phosphatase family metal-dependent hydrolase|nr:endonuclease/exonuclease/phosphatase family protein [Bacteroidales bacterium]
MGKKASIGWRIVQGLAVFFAVLLLFAFAAAFVNPEKFVWLAYFGMLFPLVLLINIFFAVFLAFNLKLMALLPILVIALNWSNVQSLAKFKSAEFDTNPQKIKVMSYNVNLFDYYGKINSQKGQTEREILDFIVGETPDIVCFQEFREHSQERAPSKRLTQAAGLRHASQSRYNKQVAFGNKIFSRFPILRDSLIRFEDSKNLVQFIDVLAYDDTVRIFNFHMESIGFQRTDDAFYRDLLTAPTEVSGLKDGVENLLEKMNRAYVKRSQQARILNSLIAASPYQTIVCGDMNDTPTSYCYHQISEHLSDSFCERALGLGTTYSGMYPAFRIDYVFFSEGLYCENFTTIRLKYSDHYPICTELKIK